MQDTNQSSGGVNVNLSAEEITDINNALNEICNGPDAITDDNEFATRIGVGKNKALLLLQKISNLLD